MILLILGWTVLPGSPWFWTFAALAVLAWPLLLQLASIPSPNGTSVLAETSGPTASR